MKNLILTTLFLSLYSYSNDINYRVLARSSESDSYKMPAYSPLRGVSPQINYRNAIAFKVPANLSVKHERIIFNTEKKSIPVFKAPSNTFVSDPKIVKDGILFTLNDTSGTKSLLKYLFKTKKVKTILDASEAKLISIFEFHQNKDAIYFRAKNDKESLGIYSLDLKDKSKKIKPLFETGQVVQGKSISYIFGLDMNDQYGVCKVRFTHLSEDAPDLIVRLDLENKVHRIIAADKDFSKKSKIISFRNSAAINDFGSIVYIANEKNKTKVFLNHFEKDNETKEIASTSKGIKSISYFTPDINNNEIIIFRAKDSKDRENLYIADTNVVKKIIRQYQIIRTDRKKKAVLMHRKNTPVFAGNPQINNIGTVVINSYIRHLNSYTNYPEDIQSAIIGIYDAPSLLY